MEGMTVFQEISIGVWATAVGVWAIAITLWVRKR